MEEEVKYTSEFDGQTTDEVLKHAKSVKDLTIPSLSNISGFVCIDNEGKAIGMMSKEQVAQVVGELIGKSYFIYRRLNFYENNSTLLRVKQLDNGWFFLLAGADSGYPALYLCSFISNSDTIGIKCEKLASGNGNSVTIYQKDGYFYFKKKWGGNSQVYSTDNSLYVVDIVNSIPDGAEEVGTY